MRGGTGNGRVYRVAFEADDGFGGSCTGSVDISVPHSRNGMAINGGQSYNSMAD